MTFDVSGFAGMTTRLRFAEAVGLNYFPFAVDNVCLSTTRGTINRPTAVGTNVAVNFGGVTLRFPSVVTAGTTSLTQLDPAIEHTGPPPGDTFIGPVYGLSTTATVTAPINVCMSLPSVTDSNTFNHLRMLQRVSGVWVELPTSQVSDGGPKVLCATVASLSQFTAAVSPGAPTAATPTISGTITTPDGLALPGVVVNLGGAHSRKTITDANGNYHFENVESGGFYTVTPSRANYNFDPVNQSFSVLSNVTDAVFARFRYGAHGCHRHARLFCSPALSRFSRSRAR